MSEAYFNSAEVQSTFPQSFIDAANMPIMDGWGGLWNSIMSFMGGAYNQAVQFPGTVTVGYGQDIMDAYSQMVTRNLTYSSYGDSTDTDEWSSVANTQIMVNRIMSSYGGHLTQSQAKAVQRFASLIGKYGPTAIGMAKQILAKDLGEGENSDTLTGILGIAENILDATYGPTGARTPFYITARGMMDGVIPIEEQNDYLSEIMQQIYPIDSDLKTTSGLPAKQAASIMRYMQGKGINVFNSNPEVTDRLVQERLRQGGFQYYLDADKKMVDPLMSRISKRQMGETLRGAQRASNLGITAQQWIDQQKDKAAARKFMETGASTDALQAQLAKIGTIQDNAGNAFDFSKLDLNTVTDISGYKNALEFQISQTDNKEKKNAYEILQKELKNYEENVVQQRGKFSIGDKVVNSSKEAFDYIESVRREDITKELQKTQYFQQNSGEIDAYTNALIAENRLRLQRYNVENLGQRDSKTGKFVWQNILEDKSVNDSDKQLIKSYFESPEGGISLQQQKKAIEDKMTGTFSEGNVALLNEYAALLQTGNQTAINDFLSKDNNKARINDLSQQLGFYYKSKDAADQIQDITGAYDSISKALVATGSGITDPGQVMKFLDMATQGGTTRLSREQLREQADFIAAGMIATGANANQVLQMGAIGNEAAKSVKGDAAEGGMNAVRAGLIASTIAKARAGGMDMTKAQAITAKAAGRASETYIAKSLNATKNLLGSLNVDVDKLVAPEKYKTILKKIKNNEDLTTEELDTIYNEGDRIMQATGATSSQISAAMNRTYVGDMAMYANMQATRALLNPTEARKAGINTIYNVFDKYSNLASLDNTKKDKLAKAISNTALKDITILQDEDPEKYKKSLVDYLNSINETELAQEVSSMNAEQLRGTALDYGNTMKSHLGVSSLEEASIATNLSDYNTWTDAERTTKGEAALRSLMPTDAKTPFQGMMKSILEGKDMGSILTAFNNSTATWSEKDKAAFSQVMSMNALVNSGKKAMGGFESMTQSNYDKVRDSMNRLLTAAGQNKESVEVIRKKLNGETLVEEEQKIWDNIQNVAGVSNDDLTSLSQTFKEGSEKARKTLDNTRPANITSNVSNVTIPEETTTATETTTEPKPTPVSEAPTTGTPAATTGTTPKEGEENKEENSLTGKPGKSPTGPVEVVIVGTTKPLQVTDQPVVTNNPGSGGNSNSEWV